MPPAWAVVRSFLSRARGRIQAQVRRMPHVHMARRTCLPQHGILHSGAEERDRRESVPGAPKHPRRLARGLFPVWRVCASGTSRKFERETLGFRPRGLAITAASPLSRAFPAAVWRGLEESALGSDAWPAGWPRGGQAVVHFVSGLDGLVPNSIGDGYGVSGTARLAPRASCLQKWMDPWRSSTRPCAGADKLARQPPTTKVFPVRVAGKGHHRPPVALRPLLWKYQAPEAES